MQKYRASAGRPRATTAHDHQHTADHPSQGAISTTLKQISGQILLASVCKIDLLVEQLLVDQFVLMRVAQKHLLERCHFTSTIHCW